MVAIKSDLTIIKVYWEGKTYQIKAENVKDTDKQDIEMTYASDSHDANWATFGKCEYSLELSGCQSHRWLFNWIRERQIKGYFKTYPRISTYRYDNSVVKLDKAYRFCFVEEISGEGQEPFDVKIVAMKRTYRDGNNHLI